MSVTLGICANRRQMELIADAVADLEPDWVDLSVLDGCLTGFGESLPARIGLGAYRAIGYPGGATSIDSAVLVEMALDLIENVMQTRATALTFGSGDFRTWVFEVVQHDVARARRILVEFVAYLAPRAIEAGISLLVEPLNQIESPVWNSLSECAADLEHLDVGLVIDRQHTWHELERVRTQPLPHVRVAHLGGPGRSVPHESEVPKLIARALSLPEVGRVLWECRWERPEEVARILTASRRALE